jgi:hypothetical protein
MCGEDTGASKALLADGDFLCSRAQYVSFHFAFTLGGDIIDTIGSKRTNQHQLWVSS